MQLIYAGFVDIKRKLSQCYFRPAHETHTHTHTSNV